MDFTISAPRTCGALTQKRTPTLPAPDMQDETQRFYRLTSYVRHYAWGMRRHGDTLPFIAELLGEEPGKNIPWAELWIGAHPSLPSTIHLANGASDRLDTFLTHHAASLLGTPEQDSLPFLLKVLSCEKPLSIQSHPDRATAQRLHEDDPAHYPDANHKPEVMLAITPFEAMAGFRPLADALNDLRGIRALAPWLHVCEQARDITYRILCETLLNLPSSIMRNLLTELHREISAQGEQAVDAARLCLRLQDENPCDRGALFAFLLNHLRLQPGEALFIPANVPHAYLAGSGIECMANSDNVIRAGLTPKFVDAKTLLATLDFSGDALTVQSGTPLDNGERLYRVPAEEFQLSIFDGANAGVNFPQRRPVASLLLVLDGSYRLATPDGQTLLAPKGSTWLRPACLQDATAQPLEPNSKLVVAEIG